jgi:hypothetical protein
MAYAALSSMISSVVPSCPEIKNGGAVAASAKGETALSCVARGGVMKTGAVLCMLSLMLCGCGNSAIDGELIGQAKKVTNVTPLLCPDYVAFDVSLGVMRNGTGSMSTQDVWFTVRPSVDIRLLKEAVDKGALVRVKYDRRRLAICTEDNILNAMEVVRE